MNENIYQICLKLKSEITSNEIYISLLESEKKMEEDDEVISLAYLKDQALDKYNDMIKYFGEDSPNTLEARKELFLAKEKFENHPLVREYLSNYQKLRLMLNEVNDIVFEGLKEKLCPNIK